MTPLRQFSGVNLMPFRRAIGVLCFFFVIAHLLVWAVLDVQTVARVWADIVEAALHDHRDGGFPAAAAAG
jgi:sulfoxide reductase heme-binding subunit YedZ